MESACRLQPAKKHGHAMSAADREMTMAFRAATAPPLEDDNILSMILVRLPPLPSSLPRVSVVCKRWRRLVTEPHFRRSFLAHHKKAPLLGFFCNNYKGGTDFRPALDLPNRMPMPSCLLNLYSSFLGCHHGRLLFLDFSGKKVNLVVWDPITGVRRHLDIPHMFMDHKIFHWKGVVVCASREQDHVHGACHSESFQVVIIGCSMEGVLACVYSSKTSRWGNLISLSQPLLPNDTLRIPVPADCQSSLVGKSVYWAHHVPVGTTDAVLEFDLHRETLAIINAPPDASNFISTSNHHDHQSFILPADGGGIGFIVLSGLSVHVWKRTSNGHGVAGWLFESTVDLGNLLSLKPNVHWINILRIVGRDEDGNMIFRTRDSGIVYLVHLKTLKFKELSEKAGLSIVHPFSSFYTTGMHAGTGMRGDENV